MSPPILILQSAVLSFLLSQGKAICFYLKQIDFAGSAEDNTLQIEKGTTLLETE
jgi:hypothetical protein